MKTLRLCLLALSLALVSTACSAESITAPQPENGGYAGSGG